MAAFTEADSARILQSLGAPAGVNGQQWLQQNPAQITAYNQQRSAAGDSWRFPTPGGLPAPTANNPYPDLNNGTGVVPLTAEPLHDWEKKGLTSLAGGLSDNGSAALALQMLREMQADPFAFASKYTNPMATQFLSQAGGAANSAMAPITQQEVESAANPAISALKNRLNEQGERARAALLASQGLRGARSFGDTAQGVRQGEIDRELLSKSSDIDYQGYQDARGWLENMRNRTLQASGQFGNLAVGAQGITNSATQSGLGGLSALFSAGAGLQDLNTTAAKNALNAGSYVRNYNQGINDYIGNDLLAETADPSNKIGKILDWLRNFQSNTAGATPGANSLQTAGGLAQAGGGLLDYFNKGDGLTADLNNLLVSRPELF